MCQLMENDSEEPFYEKFDRLGNLLQSMNMDQIRNKVGHKEGQRITLDDFIKAITEESENE
jgi:hypothetical protein